MIPPKLFFHPSALEEAEAAARWYRERSPRAALRFLSDLDHALDDILAAPLRWPAGISGTRRIKLPCFPFSLIYVESSAVIRVIAVAHGRRRPGYWRKGVYEPVEE